MVHILPGVLEPHPPIPHFPPPPPPWPSGRCALAWPLEGAAKLGYDL